VAPQREWFEKDYYKVLGVGASADQKAITKAYRKLARETHPDTNPGKEERFKEVSAAYDVLGDADRRKEYDEVRRLGPAASPFGGGGGAGGGGPFGGGFRVEDLGDLGDVLGGIFGRGRNRAGGAQGPGRRARSGAPTSRPSSTSASPTPSTGSPPRSTSRARHRARPAPGPAPSPAPPR
jgi:molecular chaperone DnaJ